FFNTRPQISVDICILFSVFSSLHSISQSLSDSLQSNPFQDHHELRPLNLRCLLSCCVRNLKRPFLQPLVVDHKAAPVPNQELDHVPPPVQKHKDITAQQISLHLTGHKPAESVKTLAYVRYPGIQKIPSLLIKTDHPTSSLR